MLCQNIPHQLYAVLFLLALVRPRQYWYRLVKTFQTSSRNIASVYEHDFSGQLEESSFRPGISASCGLDAEWLTDSEKPSLSDVQNILIWSRKDSETLDVPLEFLFPWIQVVLSCSWSHWYGDALWDQRVLHRPWRKFLKQNVVAQVMHWDQDLGFKCSLQTLFHATSRFRKGTALVCLCHSWKRCLCNSKAQNLAF